MNGLTETEREENDVVHTHPATGVQKGCPACDALMSPLVDGFDIRTNAERERDALAARLASVKALLTRAAERIRHDHAYPMEIGDHHCPGDDLEADIAAVLGSDAHTEQKGTGE